MRVTCNTLPLKINSHTGVILSHIWNGIGHSTVVTSLQFYIVLGMRTLHNSHLLLLYIWLGNIRGCDLYLLSLAVELNWRKPQNAEGPRAWWGPPFFYCGCSMPEESSCCKTAPTPVPQASASNLNGMGNFVSSTEELQTKTFIVWTACSHSDYQTNVFLSLGHWPSGL